MQGWLRALTSWENTRHWTWRQFALLWAVLVFGCFTALGAQECLLHKPRPLSALAVMALCAGTCAWGSGLYGRQRALETGRKRR